MMLRTQLAVILGLIIPASALLAQIKSGAIQGVVTDPSGALVSGAQVELSEQETQFSQSTATNNSGEFSFLYLPAGRYSVFLKKDGFNSFRTTDIVLTEVQKYQLPIRLTVGQVTSTVIVTADALQLQTESSAVQSSVGERIVNLVPNVTQNPLYYATLQAGVVGRMENNLTQATQSFGIGFDGRRFFSAFNINGGTAFTNDIQLDGLSVMGAAWNEATVLPNTDSLQEVRVATNNFSAEYGRGQGVVEMATKSGTNQFHGGVYYRNRNEDMNANSFMNNADNIARQPFRVNDFGGSIGGPIIKDKLFFFTSFERLLHNDSPEWLLTVPTAAQRTGDFSQTLRPDFNGQPVPVVLYNPSSVTQVGPNVYQHAPYPNAVITNANPYALKIMSIYPLPNRTPTDAFGSNNFFTTENRTFQRSSSNSRVDYHLGRQSLYASGGISNGTINTPSPYGAKSPFYLSPTTNSSYGGTEPESVSDDNPYVQFGDTIILNPSTVLDVRYGITRVNSNFLSNTAQNFTASDYASYGIPATVQAAMPQFGSAPDLSPGGIYSDASNAWYNNKHERQTNHQVTGSLSKTLGKWTFKGGAEYRVNLSNFTDYQNAATAYTSSPGNYTAEYTDANGNGTAQNVTVGQTGFPSANLFTGGGGWIVSQTFSPRPALAAKYFAIYSQNDWHATSRLTINLGLRWDLQPGPTDRFNRSSDINLAEMNAFGTPGSIVFPGHDGLSRNLWNTVNNDFGPRVGFAYRFTNAWVLRGGYGVSYAPNNTGWYDGPYTYAMGAFAPGTNVLPYGTSPNGTLVGNFSSPAVSSIVPSVGANSAAPQLYGSGFPFFNRNGERPPRLQQWNVFVERQLAHSWLVSAGYVGSHGNNLQISRLALQNDQDLPTSVTSSWRQAYIASNGLENPGNNLVPNPLQSTTGALRPFQGILGDRVVPQNITYYPYLALNSDSIQSDQAISNYNALQARVRRAFSSGLFLDLSYTWSKSTDNVYTELQDEQGFSDTSSSNGIDIRNLKNNMKLSSSDVPHRFVSMLTYDLPFGKGGQLAIPNSVARAVLGGWQIGSVLTFQSGYPLGPTDANSGALNGRPNLVQGQALTLPKSLQGWYNGTTTITLPDGRKYTPCAQCYLKYNPDAFSGEVVSTPNGSSVTDIYWTGDAALNYGAIRGPGRNNVDLTLSRNFHLTERVVLSIRANVSNAFNHTQFLSNSYSTDLGGTVAVGTPALGVIAGQGSSNSYGTHGLGTFDPRQVILEGRIQF
jgi:trimeric autotransporter adhesin